MVVQALEVCTFSQQLWLGEIPAHLPMVLSRVGNVGEENGYLTGRYKNGTWQVDSCCMYANDTGECWLTAGQMHQHVQIFDLGRKKMKHTASLIDQ